MKIDLFKDYLTFDFLFEQIEELFLSLISGSRKKNYFFVLWYIMKHICRVKSFVYTYRNLLKKKTNLLLQCSGKKCISYFNSTCKMPHTIIVLHHFYFFLLTTTRLQYLVRSLAKSPA